MTKIFILDAGHGGSDPGAIGYLDGKMVREADIALACVRSIVSLSASEPSYQVSATRLADSSMAISQRKSFCAKTPHDYAIHLHLDASSSKARRGARIYHWSPSPRGQELAHAIFKTMPGLLLEEAFSRVVAVDRTWSDATQPTWMHHVANVLKISRQPAVLIEAGFVTSPDVTRYYLQQDGVAQFALSLVAAMKNMSAN